MEIDYSRLCHGCFTEKSTPVCPYCGYDATSPADYPLALQPGSVLNGKYMAGRVLGQGGFGITYLGFDLTLQVKVAIKEYMPVGQVGRTEDHSTVNILSRKDAEGFEAGKEKFLDEARILAKVQNSPNIVKVQNYFHENNTAYFVMEYIEGASLKDCMAQQGGRLPYQQAENLLLPIAEALGNVHTQNLLHRDISPDNIFVTQGGQSKLLDFGAARFAMGDQKSLSVILKHGFAPEEQYRTRGNQGPWTDIYALGATFYNAITGALPPDAIERLHNDTLAPPSALGVQLPPHAEAAIIKALAVKAENRFYNMSEFIAALTGRSYVPVQAPVPAPAPAQANSYEGGASYGSTAYASPQQSYGQTMPLVQNGTQYPAAAVSTALPFWKRWSKQTLAIAGGAVGLVLILLVVLIIALAGRGKSGDGGTAGGGGGGTVGGGGSLPPIGGTPGSSEEMPPDSSASQPSGSSGGQSIASPSGNFYSTDAVGGGISLSLIEGWTVDESALSTGVIAFTSPVGSRILVAYHEGISVQNLRGELPGYMSSMAQEIGGDGAAMTYEEENCQMGNYLSYYFTFTCNLNLNPIYFVHNYLIDGAAGCYNIVYLQEFSNISSNEVQDVVAMLFTLTIYELE